MPAGECRPPATRLPSEGERLTHEASFVCNHAMSIDDRRSRERDRRRRDILDAAWQVAESEGWVAFSVEKVAARAELGRATVYSYFESFEALVAAMAGDALERLSARTADAPGLTEALDVPVRFSQESEAAFSLLFPPGEDPRPPFRSEAVQKAQRDARNLVTRLDRLASKAGASLPSDSVSSAAFIAGISMAGAYVPELRTSTPLRRQWQMFCLGLPGDPEVADPER